MKLYFWVGLIATLAIGVVIWAAAFAAWNAISPVAGFIVWAALMIPGGIAAGRLGTWSAERDFR